MDLAEFLLARVAEDEVEARKRLHRAQRHDLTVRDPKHLGQFMPGWHEWREIEAFAARVLADCEAKRRIVEEFQRCGPNTVGHIGLLGALQFLALPYADHPDYRQEWRP